MLDWLATCAELPPNVRFVITSRPDTDLLARMRTAQRQWQLREEIIDPAQQTAGADVERYLRDSLSRQPLASQLDPHGLGGELAVTVARRAAGNFQYAAAFMAAVQSAAPQAIKPGCSSSPARENCRQASTTSTATSSPWCESQYATWAFPPRKPAAYCRPGLACTSPCLPCWRSRESHCRVRSWQSTRAFPPTQPGSRTLSCDSGSSSPRTPGGCSFTASLADFLTSPQAREHYRWTCVDAPAWHRRLVDRAAGRYADRWNQATDYLRRQLAGHAEVCGLATRSMIQASSPRPRAAVPDPGSGPDRGPGRRTNSARGPAPVHV